MKIGLGGGTSFGATKSTDELAGGTRRWPHEWVADPAPDARLPSLRMLEQLASRKTRLADVALSRARHLLAQAEQAVVDAERALADRIAFVKSERQRLVAERQAVTDGSSSLQRWREADQALLGSIQHYRDAIEDRRRELDGARQALVQAEMEQQRHAKRHEKFDLLIEQIRDDA